MEEPSKVELQRMLAGEAYNSWDPLLLFMRETAARLTSQFNRTALSETAQRDLLVRELLGKVGENCYITPPFNVDYGCHIFLGDNFYANANCVFLDCNTITIGDNVLLGPNVQLFPATHPTDPTDRLAGIEYAYPIKIGSNVWIGGGAIICPGVTIGDNTTIGAGSVVTKDVPPCTIAAGNPCKVIRTLDATLDASR